MLSLCSERTFDEIKGIWGQDKNTFGSSLVIGNIDKIFVYMAIKREQANLELAK